MEKPMMHRTKLKRRKMDLKKVSPLLLARNAAAPRNLSELKTQMTSSENDITPHSLEKNKLLLNNKLEFSIKTIFISINFI